MFSSRNQNTIKVEVADCISAAKEGDIAALNIYLRELPGAMLGSVDDEGNTLLHYAAANGQRNLFYHLLQLLKQQRDDLFAYELQGMEIVRPLSTIFKNNKGMTPWHTAAQFGQIDFFKQPMDELENSIWQELKLSWLNFQDKDGNAPLHYAVFYSDKSKNIKNKKHTVSTLVNIPELNINIQNDKGQTALHVVAMTGCYETGKVLLKAREKFNFTLCDTTNKTVKDHLMDKAHKRLLGAHNFYANPARAPSTGQTTKAQLKEISTQPFNFDDEEFFTYFKQVQDVTHSELNQLMQTRYDVLFEKHASNFRWKAIASMLCPAFALSTIAGTISGAISLAAHDLPTYIVVSSMGTLITLPFVYAPLVYSCYQSYVKEMRINQRCIHKR